MDVVISLIFEKALWLTSDHYDMVCWNLFTICSLKLCVPDAGTRIIYDRKFLLDRRNSPIAQTPPAHLPVIPGVTSQKVVRENQKNEANNRINKHDDKPANGMRKNAMAIVSPTAVIM